MVNLPQTAPNTAAVVGSKIAIAILPAPCGNAVCSIIKSSICTSIRFAGEQKAIRVGPETLIESIDREKSFGR